jgi:hypothetical protein
MCWPLAPYGRARPRRRGLGNRSARSVAQLARRFVKNLGQGFIPNCGIEDLPASVDCSVPQAGKHSRPAWHQAAIGVMLSGIAGLWKKFGHPYALACVMLSFRRADDDAVLFPEYVPPSQFPEFPTVSSARTSAPAQ